MTNAISVSCGNCMGARSGQCTSCELVQVTNEREVLARENAELRARLAALAGGLSIPGWWCVACAIFNGEMHSPRSECRHCGRAKAVRS